MELIDNITKTLRDDLAAEFKPGSRVSMAAACFSIYAFQELKEQLQGIKELRFIFTSPTFTSDRVAKQRREFYIPRIDRERTLYGSPFEVRLHNQLTQKAYAKLQRSVSVGRARRSRRSIPRPRTSTSASAC